MSKYSYMVLAPGFTPYYNASKGAAMAVAKLMADAVLYRIEIATDNREIIYRNRR